MIISISGKKQSGKDTVGQIIQYLIATKDLSGRKDSKIQSFEFQGLTKNNWHDIHLNCDWQIRKFATIMKNMVCLLLGCTMEDLENEKFKSKELGEEWWYWKSDDGFLLPYNNSTGTENYTLIKLTPRKLLQLIGTDCGRDIIHPNIWINSLMGNYKRKEGYWINKCDLDAELSNKVNPSEDVYPNWLITDCRFENEVDAIKDRKGIVIRVNRPKIIKRCFSDKENDFVEEVYDPNNKLHVDLLKGELIKNPEHESETTLDDYKEFDYVINNDGSISELIEKVKEILVKEKIIK